MLIPVTAENFTRAESDMYFDIIVRHDGGFAKFAPKRTLAPIERQSVIRENRDTLYSSAVFDLDAGRVTVALPASDGRFMSMEVIDEDEYVFGVYYDAEPHSLAREAVGTRYVIVAVRILVDPNDPADLARVHALQDAIRTEQPGGPGEFAIPQWDRKSQDHVRELLIALAQTMPAMTRCFGARDEVDPVQHLLGAAMGWGGNPAKDALYLNVTPARNDGSTVHRLTVKDVPVDGFWSVIVYDAKGYIPANDRDVYSYNSVTATKDADGSVTIQFGGDPGSAANCIPIVPGWNYMVRLYRPRAEILEGSWTFPEARAVG